MGSDSEDKYIVDAITPRTESRRLKKKKRHPKFVTSHLQLYEELKPRNLKALILGTAVYLCVEEQVVGIFDALCFGNLDGGPGTAAHVKQRLQTLGLKILGEKSIRISLEEAMFMSFAIEILTVYSDVDGVVQPLDNTALWQTCSSLRTDFVTLYLSYHHFRSKGWIPRTGLQYGADMVIYQRHPAIAHSDYSVLIVPLNFGDRPDGCWHELQILNRLTTQVSKMLIVLYIEEQPGCDRTSPECIWQFAVQERLVRRWVPEGHRKPAA